MAYQALTYTAATTFRHTCPGYTSPSWHKVLYHCTCLRQTPRVCISSSQRGSTGQRHSLGDLHMDSM